MAVEEPSAWMTAPEAVRRLGVKPQTLYAYVSRGLIRAERVPAGRESRYRRADVERLANRGRRRPDTGPDLVVDSAITYLDPAGHLYYRGRDVTRRDTASSYEAAAELLWDAGSPGPLPWSPLPGAVKVAHRAVAALPPDATLPDRLRVAAAAIAPCDPLRDDRRPESVAARTRSLVAALVVTLPPADSLTRPDPMVSIAARLWPRLSPAASTSARVATLDRALVLLADHELAASTLAVRVAASTWADPYLLVLTGLAAAGGPLHAGASHGVRELLAEIRGGTPAARAVGTRLRDDRPVAGFGHSVYEGPDPRAVALLSDIRTTGPPREVVQAATRVVDLMARDGGPQPNIDFALGVLAEAHDMVPGAGEAIFVIARCAGWIAHALEEYRYRLRYRVRAAYTGPPVSRSAPGTPSTV